MTPEDIEAARGAIRAVRESATGRGILGPAALNCAAMLERALADRRSILDTTAALVNNTEALLQAARVGERDACAAWVDEQADMAGKLGRAESAKWLHTVARQIRDRWTA